MLICVVRRAPLVPIGSFTTCTTMSWPSRSSSTIGTLAGGGRVVFSVSALATGAGRTTSLACRNAARSSPPSTKAACMPGMTRCTLPL
ncbi:hypothetical protein G6F65_013068 [Rhizopus arrhizus]|nr:hypothetical protein G6F65_013068 [Rhizopus arrhizus]